LCIPIPKKNKANVNAGVVKIQLEYMPKMRIVVAHVVQDTAVTSSLSSSSLSSSRLWESGRLLLQNLFQEGDDGLDFPHGSCEHLSAHCKSQNKKSNGNSNSNSDCKGIGKGKDTNNDEEDDGANNVDGDGDGDGMEEDVDFDMNDDDDDDDHHNESDINIDTEESKSTQASAIEAIRHSLRRNPTSVVIGRPYHWCQYMSGLYHPAKQIISKLDLDDDNDKDNNDINDPVRVQGQGRGPFSSPPTPPMESTTRTILQQLQRRVTSHTMMAVWIETLKKLPSSQSIPLHPSMMDSNSNSASSAGAAGVDTKLTKLIEFREGKNDEEGVGGAVYHMILKRKTQTIKMTVTVDVRYPSIAPLWHLQNDNRDRGSTRASTSTNTNGYGNGKLLGQIEKCVNTLEDGNDGYEFFKDDVEESYYWILMRQLQYIITAWTKCQEEIETGVSVNVIVGAQQGSSSSTGSASGASSVSLGGVKRKGRSVSSAYQAYHAYRHAL